MMKTIGLPVFLGAAVLLLGGCASVETPADTSTGMNGL